MWLVRLHYQPVRLLCAWLAPALRACTARLHCAPVRYCTVRLCVCTPRMWPVRLHFQHVSLHCACTARLRCAPVLRACTAPAQRLY
jgi:hypothetical protein